MDKYFEYMQNMQEDLVGVIIPVLITAVVSILSLFINSVMSILIENKKFNQEHAKTFQAIYTTFKVKLMELDFLVEEMSADDLFVGINDAVIEFIEYDKDCKKYIKKHKDNIVNWEKFMIKVKDFINKMSELYSFLYVMVIPGIPISHPILKYKIYKMIANLQCYTLLLYKFTKKEWSHEKISSEIRKLNDMNGCHIRLNFTKKYIKLIDKWFMVY